MKTGCNPLFNSISITQVMSARLQTHVVEVQKQADRVFLLLTAGSIELVKGHTMFQAYRVESECLLEVDDFVSQSEQSRAVLGALVLQASLTPLQMFEILEAVSTTLFHPISFLKAC